MNNTDLLIKKAEILRQVSEFLEDNLLDIDLGQLYTFEHEVTELMLECGLSNTYDNIAKSVYELAEAKGFKYA